MKKKKSSKHKPSAKPASLSQNSYLASGRARHLPIYKCWITKDWQEAGMAIIFVVRKHANGHVTVGEYLVDTFCTGVKDTVSLFNVPEFEFVQVKQAYPQEFVECSYELAHNIIYGAIAFAQDYGIAPHPGFNLTRYLLEEDTEDIPLIELAFGKDGKPLLVLSPNPRNAYFQRQLQQHAAEGEYDILRLASFGEGEEERELEEKDEKFDRRFESWDEVDWEDFLENTPPEKLKYYPALVPYLYIQTLGKTPEAAPVAAKLRDHAALVISGLELPEAEIQQSPEEEQSIEEIRELLEEEVTSGETGNLEKALRLSQEYLARWPQNPVFYLLLSDVQQFSGQQPEAVAATIQNLYDRFPDLLIAKIMYAHLMQIKGNIEAVNAFLQGKYLLTDLEPQRKTFSIREVLEFYQMMTVYFMLQDQLPLASLYVYELENLPIPTDLPFNFSLLLLISTEMAVRLVPVWEKARESETEKEALIKAILA
ncbi:MAG: tetratricopeptide repeat protein [Adhaeribacter sp.]